MHDIDIFPEPEIADAKKPEGTSSFESWKQENILRLCAIVREEIERVTAAAPAALVRACPLRRLPLFRNVQGYHQGAAVHLKYANRLTFEGNRRTGVIAPVGYKPPLFRGLSIQVENEHDIWKEEPVSHIRACIGHELLHILSALAIHPHCRPTMEALVARVERSIYGERTGLTMQRRWYPGRFQSTTGLCPPDFAEIENDLVALEAMYLSSHSAANRLSSEHVWKIWSLLTQQTLTTGYMPKEHNVHRTIREVAGEEGQQTLATAAFQPMREGVHHMVFPAGEGITRIYSFIARRNPRFGMIESDGVRHETLFECKGIRVQGVRHELFDSADQPMTDIQGNASLDPIQEVSYENLWKKILTAGPLASSVLNRLGNRMRLHIPSLRPIELLQNDSAPEKDGCQKENR